MKILLTGASGLVGGCLHRALATAHKVTGTYCSRPVDGLVPLDITDADAVMKLARDGTFTHIISNAALRSPDYCIDHADEAYRVNAVAVEYLAQAANEIDATMVQISTDYVFPGTNPPYREDDTPEPINLYGRTKLAGEHAARVAKKHLIVRIPAQWRTDLSDPRNAATEIATWLRNGETRTVDAETVRYYTLTEDVAQAVRFLMERGEEGLFQVSAEQKTTKAGFARKLCVALGLDPAQVQDGPPPDSGDVRPFDSHLDTARYRALGGPTFHDIDSLLNNLKG